MQELKQRIRQDLNNYQNQVTERLENLIRLHKISRSEYEMLLMLLG
ncbi:MAG: hypothetical protein VKL59_12110 [Nostocaceae cyanobacterium]|nr:hypothetical protein [Nostocaceae cyanobacterium]